MTNNLELEKELKLQLAKIGWSLADRGCGFYQFVDNKGKLAPITFCRGRLEFGRDSKDSWSCTWYLSNCIIEEMKKNNNIVDAICIRGKKDKDIFIILYKWE